MHTSPDYSTTLRQSNSSATIVPRSHYVPDHARFSGTIEIDGWGPSDMQGMTTVPANITVVVNSGDSFLAPLALLSFEPRCARVSFFTKKWATFYLT
jgi:hypothetical protein